MTSAFKEGYNMLRITNGASCNAMIYISGTGDYLFDLSVVGGDWAQGTINPTVPSGRLRLKLGGTDKYIQLYNNPS